MTAFTIRKATIADVPALVARLAAMVQAMESVGGHPAADENLLHDFLRSRLKEHLPRTDHLYLVADSNAQLVGAAEASIYLLSDVFRDCRMLHIHAVYVDDSQRRQGIGRALMEAILEWGRVQNCEQAELNVLANNPAKQLYESLGFRVFQHEMLLRLSP